MIINSFVYLVSCSSSDFSNELQTYNDVIYLDIFSNGALLFVWIKLKEHVLVALIIIIRIKQWMKFDI